MRAALWHGNGRHVEVDDVNLPAPGPHEVVVDTTAVVACITDVIAFDNPPFPPGAHIPQIPGHGGVGIVSAVGSDVSRVRVGDTVLASANPWCGVCYACLRDRPDMCGELTFLGPEIELARTGSTVAHSYLGSYAEQMLTREIQVVPLTTGLSHQALAVLADGGAGGVGGAFNVAPVTAGASVAVVGCGMTGLAYLQSARVLGAETIIAIDPLAHRREIAEKFGATHTFDANDPDLVEKVKEVAGSYPALFGDKRGVEFAFEASGEATAMGTAMAITRPTGHVVLASVTKDFLTATLPISAFDAAMNGKQIHGCQWGQTNLLRDIPVWTRLLERGELDFDSMVSTTVGLDAIDGVLNQVADCEVVAAVVEPRR